MSTTVQAPISVQQHPKLGPSVSARAIYSKVAVSHASRDVFSDWYRDKQRKLDLVEGKDFVTTSINVAGTNRKHIEHILTVGAAQRMAATATSGRGMDVFTYLNHYPNIGQNSAESSQVNKVNTREPSIAANDAPVLVPGVTRVYGDAAPTPEPPIVSTPAGHLSPAQQLLAEVQKLVDAEQKRKDEPEAPSEQFKGLEARLNQLEKNINIILYFFQQSSTALRALAPAQLPYDATLGASTLPDLEPTKRIKVNRLVDGYAAAKTVSHQEVWKHLYGHLSSRFGFDAWQHAQSKKYPNYLEIVEENGQLDNLYSIAVELLTLSQR